MKQKIDFENNNLGFSCVITEIDVICDRIAFQTTLSVVQPVVPLSTFPLIIRLTRSKQGKRKSTRD